MTIQQLEIQLIASVVAVACSLVGVFLVLRRMAMMSDAISHTVLLGIVVTFFLVQDLGSPLLIIGAAATGVLTISLVELLNKTRLVKEDAAIGLVFPALFSIAVILISRFATNVHLDSDSVLLGELAFAPFDRFELFGTDLAPKALVMMSVILLINVLFIVLFYKELKLATFDTGLAATLGFAPGLIHYGLMSLVSITAVGAFDAVGSILVVAMMIGPAAAAYLLTDHLPRMLGLSALIGVLSAVSGYWLAHWLDASIAGSMATMVGVVFLATFLFAPERGMIAVARRRARQKWEFAQRMLVIHLLNHENTPEAETESRVEHMHHHMRWEPDFASSVIARGVQADWIIRQNGHVVLTEKGREVARVAIIDETTGSR
ncbi:MAG: metal ABC transporter permease [Anaerolineae bacterium]|nr:metal ABC transporter permease [Anaerolineae bacterium]